MMNEASQTPERSFWARHFWRIFIWFWVVLAVGFFLYSLQPQRPPVAVLRLQLTNNLKDVGLALLNYHDTYGSFPPAYVVDRDGEPLYSWRVLILPFLEESELYEEFHLDEPWSSNHNRPLLPRIPKVYQSPYLPYEEQDDGLTPVRGIVDKHKERTILRPGHGIAIDAISDGPGNTGLLIGDPAHLVEWTKPEDIDPLNLLVRGDLDQTKLKGVLVVHGDGSIHFMDRENWRELVGLVFYDDGRMQKETP